MRLNKNTYPAYFDLVNNNYGYLKIDKLIIDTILKDKQTFVDFIESLRYTFKQVDKKYYITNTFKDSIVLAYPKIVKDEKHIKEIPSHCGIIFTDKGFSLYLSNPTDKKIKLLVYGFTRDVLTTYGIIDNDDKFFGVAANVDETGEPINDTKVLSMYLSTLLVALYFIDNCEIEEKILKPDSKHRENGNKHFNESKSDLVILDCKWFTDLIRTIPFHVKGHFRWQAHGEKKTKRKLIWISEFEKNGYVRKAKKHSIT